MTRKLLHFFIATLICSTIITPAIAKNQYSAFTVEVIGKGKPVLLIPGATCSGHEWDETVEHLKDKYECHVITLAGYAGTRPMAAAPYLPNMQKQIIQYIADNNLKDVTLIGHSIGGFLSLCIATEMKSRLNSIIVVDALPFFAGTSNPDAPTTFTIQAAEKLYSHYDSMNDEEMFKSQLRNAQFLCLDSSRWSMIAGWGAASDKRTFAYTITEMMTNDIRQQISKIEVPVLVLVAYAAIPGYPAFSRESVTQVFTEQYAACSKCVVHVAKDHAKHFIMYDTPDWYFSEIDNFMSR